VTWSESKVAVVGAGPFGLSVAAHLAPHRHVRTFGEPMHTWRALMPQDMLRRSHWDETKLSCPGDLGTLHHWAAEAGVERREPLALEMFLRSARAGHRGSAARSRVGS
jgi:hypothetical protein